MIKKAFNLDDFDEEIKQYFVEQEYDLYTPMDHAAWRYIMRVNMAFFEKHAHPKHLEGMKKLGILSERIPKIEEMDSCLQKFGWRAVAVSGFIPPAMFLEIQAKGVLPIACDMRTLEHIAYTPAPDIVHEAAGHAPMIVDPDYANYLRTYGEISENAIFSKEDMDVYEAILNLSVTKEDPASTQDEILASQKRLDQTLSAVTYTSEAAMLTRMAWWTTEYGLVGSTENPLIYGAGLLSSAGESFECLKQAVAKIPFSLDCIYVNFDITKPQPQLFLSPDFITLKNVIHDFSKTMAYRLGGLPALAKAKLAKTVTSTQLESGIQIGGILKEIYNNVENGVYYLQYEGPSQLAYQKKQLSGHGPKYHASGFGTPVGLIKDLNLPASELTLQNLEKMGFKNGAKGKLHFKSGVLVEGILLGETKIENKAKSQIIVMSFKDCSVTYKGKILFDPSWGIFDMACGKEVVSVFGGAPDRGSYFAEIGKKIPKGKAKTNLTSGNKQLCEFYLQVRKIRESQKVEETTLEKILAAVEKQYPADWLLTLEILELSEKNKLKDLVKKCRSRLANLRGHQGAQLESLIARGLEVLLS